MAKIRLTQPGFQTYSGQMGVLMFENGLSTTDVSENDARRIGAVMRCEWEGGADPSLAQRLLDNLNTPAPMFTADGKGTDHDTAAAKAAAHKVEVAKSVNDTPATSEAWTQEKLEALADSKGIKGLREIADPMGIKATSIKELIAAILKGKPLET